MRKGGFTRRWFKQIPDFPGYWINRHGKVWSEKRKKFLVWSLNSKDYLRASLYRQGRRFQTFVHRIVATLFCKNPNPAERIEVNHLDYNTRNPYFKNLRWDTPAENRAHRKLKPWNAYVNETAKRIDETVAVPF